MNSILFFIIFTISIFAILTLALRVFPKDASFTFAIGAVIGSNIYTSTEYPIDIGGFVFGIDSIVYTIFAFCLLFMYITFGKHDMKVVLYTSIFSIFFTAFLFFMGNLSQSGFSMTLLMNTLSFVASIVATFCAVWVMVWAYDLLRKKNVNLFISIFVGLVVASIVNSFIYFGLSFLIVGQLGENFWLLLAGSYMGKFVACMLCLLVYAIYCFWSRKGGNILKKK